MSEIRMLPMKGRPPAESAAMSAMVLANKPWQERADLLTAALAEARALALREAAEALDADLQHAIDELHEGRTPFGGDTLHRFAYGVKAHIAARLDALAQEVERG